MDTPRVFIDLPRSPEEVRKMRRAVVAALRPKFVEGRCDDGIHGAFDHLTEELLKRASAEDVRSDAQIGRC